MTAPFSQASPFAIHGLCVVPSFAGLRKYVVSAVLPLGEGCQQRLGRAVHAQLEERGRGILEKARALVSTLRSPDWCGEGKLDLKYLEQPIFSFYTRRLEGHAVVTGGGRTAVRRECGELPTGCLMFGDRPARKTAQGLAFRVRVESTTSKFSGLPFVGFTTRRPCGQSGGLPLLSKCLAESVVVGGCGEAFARDKSTHYVMGFKPPPTTEIQSWSLQPDVPPHRREPPAVVHAGDLIDCMYTWDGRLQFLINDTTVMDFDTGRPLAEDAHYYAVVDVCFSTASLTLMPSSKPSAFRATEFSSVSTIAPCDLNSTSAGGHTASGSTCLERQSTGSSSSSGRSEDLGAQLFDEDDPGRRCLPLAETILRRALYVGMFGIELPSARHESLGTSETSRQLPCASDAGLRRSSPQTQGSR
ncbi:unnamed protein product [Prorocentrum cordatum]|uniref:NHR domain-containing protein n=1 Tax=Prorocentrum cordatum TaxID=2364126 RepID=A0ABN9Y8Z2_9DINO|nr:unnamed protein product [Polarella glacialis]